MHSVVNASAGGTFLDNTAGGSGLTAVLSGVRLRAGADAATATVKETDTNGRILAVLGAGIGLTDEQLIPVSYIGKVFVVTTGTTPVVLLFQR